MDRLNSSNRTEYNQNEEDEPQYDEELVQRLTEVIRTEGSLTRRVMKDQHQQTRWDALLQNEAISMNNPQVSIDDSLHNEEHQQGDPAEQALTAPRNYDTYGFNVPSSDISGIINDIETHENQIEDLNQTIEQMQDQIDDLNQKINQVQSDLYQGLFKPISLGVTTVAVLSALLLLVEGSISSLPLFGIAFLSLWLYTQFEDD